jgi:transposase, IS30 family
MRIAMNPELKRFVMQTLEDGQSPEATSGRLGTGKDLLPHVSGDTIRRFIKSPHGRRIEAMRERHKPRRKRSKRTSLKDRTFIDQRPLSIAKRSHIGDAEGDFIVSGKSGKGVLLVIDDRKSRYPFIERVLPVTVRNIYRACLKIKKKFPEWKTMTTDNDILFRGHKEMEKLLGIKIYFCLPHHPWEKGSVENMNKCIRKDIPKGSDLSKLSMKQIRQAEKKLRERFMECLNYSTPEEILTKYCERQKQRRNGVVRRN